MYIKICVHCEEKSRGKYCADCTTKAKRKEMDENNKEVFRKAGLDFRHNCIDERKKK